MLEAIAHKQAGIMHAMQIKKKNKNEIHNPPTPNLDLTHPSGIIYPAA